MSFWFLIDLSIYIVLFHRMYKKRKILDFWFSHLALKISFEQFQKRQNSNKTKTNKK